MQLFHYHLATNRVRDHEQRYVEDLGFRLVARHGSLGSRAIAAGPEREWPELEQLGFQHRLTELERDGVNVVVQPGRWEPPLVDHVGVLATQAELELVLGRATASGSHVQERNGRRTFVTTGAGYRLELRTDRACAVAPFSVSLAAEDAAAAAAALGALLDLEPRRNAIEVGRGVVRFLPGGQSGRPRLAGERIGTPA